VVKQFPLFYPLGSYCAILRVRSYRRRWQRAEGRGQRVEEGERAGVVDACWQVLIPLAEL
jgi:hypothetical protein